MFYVIVALLAVFDVVVWRWTDRQFRPLRRATLWRGISGALIGVQLLGLVLMILPTGVKALVGAWFWRPVSAYIYIWHLLVTPVFVLLLGLGYAGVGVFKAARGEGGTAREEDSDPQPAGDLDSGGGAAVAVMAPVVTSRRRFLGAAAALAPQIGLGGALLESARQAGQFRVREMDVKIPGLPAKLDGAVIAHVSDTHSGRFVRERELDHIVGTTIGLKPDLVAFTGDLIDFNLIDLDMSVAALKRLERGTNVPLAVCVGNHDLFEDGRAFRRRLRTEGVGLMVDEVMPVTVRGERFNLLGLDWGMDGQPRADAVPEHMRRLIDKHWSGGFGILLAHHPHAFDPAADAGIPLTLSGHTHGGQIMLAPHVGLGPIAYKYYSGLYAKGRQRLVVSNGVGNWFPIRIGAPAEIVKITLRREG